MSQRGYGIRGNNGLAARSRGPEQPRPRRTARLAAHTGSTSSAPARAGAAPRRYGTAGVEFACRLPPGGAVEPHPRRGDHANSATIRPGCPVRPSSDGEPVIARPDAWKYLLTIGKRTVMILGPRRWQILCMPVGRCGRKSRRSRQGSSPKTSAEPADSRSRRQCSSDTLPRVMLLPPPGGSGSYDAKPTPSCAARGYSPFTTRRAPNGAPANPHHRRAAGQGVSFGERKRRLSVRASPRRSWSMPWGLCSRTRRSGTAANGHVQDQEEPMIDCGLPGSGADLCLGDGVVSPAVEVPGHRLVTGPGPVDDDRVGVVPGLAAWARPRPLVRPEDSRHGPPGSMPQWSLAA